MSVISGESQTSGTKLYADGGGLYLQVTTASIRSWIFRYTLRGVAGSFGIGPLHTVTLLEAREEALRLRKLVRSGIAPALDRARTKAAAAAALHRTFRACAEEFIKSKEEDHRSKKAHAQWSSTLEKYVYPHIGDLPVADIDVHMIHALLMDEDAWIKKTATMKRVRGRIESILGWAAALGMRSEANPARYQNFLGKILPGKNAVKKINHHPSMPFDQLPGFLQMLKAQPKSISFSALEFLILTATRTSEVLGARWSEISFETCRWDIPADRMKSGRPHEVPLSKRAVEILADIKKDKRGEFVFYGQKAGKSLSNMAMLEAMRGFFERGLTDKYYVPHGFRSSFRRWCSESSNYSRELAEFSLAHVIENKTERAYMRGTAYEKRIPLMEDWSAHCLSLASSSPLPRPKKLVKVYAWRSE